MRKNIFVKSVLLLAVALTMVFVGCATVNPYEEPVAYEAGKEYSLVVLHTNDHHGTVLAKDGVAGLAERATFVKGVRAENENVLVLDAGDINTGSALSNMFKAEPDIKAYNMIGYDAVTFGNHEFDGDLSVLKNQMKMSEFQWISANIVTGNGKPLAAPYYIKDFDGFRVGVIGLTTLRTEVIASPDASLTFLDEVETAQKYVDMLRNDFNVNVVIVLGHIGLVDEVEG